MFENIYDEFEMNNIKMRQYHIDTRQVFSNLAPKLSIYNTHPKQLIIIGQDESVFKQYSFGSKYWMGEYGEMKLLPKSDGYSRMVSAFVSRELGVDWNWMKKSYKEWMHGEQAVTGQIIYQRKKELKFTEVQKKEKKRQKTYVDPVFWSWDERGGLLEL